MLPLRLAPSPLPHPDLQHDIICTIDKGSGADQRNTVARRPLVTILQHVVEAAERAAPEKKKKETPCHPYVCAVISTYAASPKLLNRSIQLWAY